jgi:hypothetical protein
MQASKIETGSDRGDAGRSVSPAFKSPGSADRAAPNARLQAQLGNRNLGELVRSRTAPMTDAAPQPRPRQAPVVQRAAWDRVKSGFGALSAGLGGLAAYGGYQGASYAATALLSSNPVGWGLLGGLAAGGLVAGGLAYLSGKDAATPPVKLQRVNFEAQPLADFPELRTASEADLTNCTFPADWADVFAGNPNIRKLTIYSPKGGPPADRLAGLVGKQSLQELELVRAEFMDAACYANLGNMLQLRRLILNRTITKEKSPGDAQMTNVANPDEKERLIREVTNLDPAVMQALLSLIAGGRLRTLELKWCTALTERDRATITASAERHGVGVVFA